MPYSFLHRRGAAALFAAASIALTTPVHAQNSAGPQPVALPPPIVAPADTPYPGTISLLVDATNITDRILSVHETIPIKGRDITLLYPEWLPGTHSPSNPASELAGLIVTVNGKRIPWVRDRVDMYAFHVEAPKDATTLDINFQYLAPQDPKRGRISAKFADVTWNSVLLYPAGHFSRDIKFETAIRLPEAWQFSSSLDARTGYGNLVQSQGTTLTS